ncbi:alpha/beta fold hydrolase [Jiangella mangrovi]|uniref:Pimeloyl-ACP methyl ester carboxylesterase n=1 Tax=Jiangella mangrovi TaxID=1524084 RepID=A0A7W9GRB1_9ACTN|nr:alpha/beta hydrolase [Jiangella mangrovi]MBB5788597.1 pimeloyl-ACP methyl ester carboxylesterase [Jiangella mangrovi]
MSTVISKDGTTIAFDAVGTGRTLIMIDGATGYPAINPLNAETAKLLSDGFRTYTYDRRGRGNSTDTAPYAIEREIEDLAALVEDAGGGPAVLFGWSSGGVLALDAAASGLLPVSHVAVFEPPFVVDDVRPPLPADYVERLDAANAAGDPGEAVAIFMVEAAGGTPEMVEGLKQSDFWPVMLGIAPTIAYDGRIMGTTMSGNPLPADRWASIDIPVLTMYGLDTWPALKPGAPALAELLPTATLKPVPGENHATTPEVLAPALRDFVEA